MGGRIRAKGLSGDSASNGKESSMNKESPERISPRELLSLIGKTQADNEEGYPSAVPWKSRLAGGMVQSLFHYHELMKTVAGETLLFGPLASLAGWQANLMDAYVTGPIKTQARIATRAGRNPDVFAEMNSWIYQTYARLLYNLCGCFMKNGKFDRRRALEISSSEEGKQLLRNYMKEFRWLELSYNSRGLTRLKAMKDLLKSLLVLITEQALEGEDMPFMKKNADGGNAMSLGAYLEEGRARIEALWRHNAFDIRDFSDRFMGGKIGYLPYEVIKGSRLHSVTLRHYPLPKGIEPNGKAVYLATPMINKPEIFDLAEGKSVVEGMLKEGYYVYLVDHGDPGPGDVNLGLDFFGKTVPDTYIDIIQKRHPGAAIYIMAYCMAGTLMLPWLARRAEERMARGEPMDIWKIALMATPVKFDDESSGQSPMRKIIREEYDPLLMKELYGEVNVPPQMIEAGMNELQPGIQHTMSMGFYSRAYYPNAIEDSAPFLYWLTHGTKFPARAHREWIELFFLGNSLIRGTYTLPSSNPALDGKPVQMDALDEAGVLIFCYRGTRDPIAPAASSVPSELWGEIGKHVGVSRGGLNRLIEKNVGHIFVVSKVLLAEYLTLVNDFFKSS
jgi:poly(3-hydroxyalkanoate) synthetase